MKLRSTLYALAAVVMLGSFFLAGCTEEDGTTNPPYGQNLTREKSLTTTAKFQTITGLSKGQRYVFAVRGPAGVTGTGTMIKGLASYGESSITVSWDRGVADNGIDTIIFKAVDNSTTTTLTVDGIDYTAMTWATATKSGPYTIYETAADTLGSTGHPSGLVISASQIKEMSTQGLGSNDVDIVLLTNQIPAGYPNLTVETGGQYSANNTRGTKIGTDAAVVRGVSTDYYEKGLKSYTSFLTSNTWNVSSATQAQGDAFVMPFVTGDNHYGRLEVESHENVANPGAYFFWQDSPLDGGHKWRYITVNVYLQSVADWDYAKTHETGNGGH